MYIHICSCIHACTCTLYSFYSLIDTLVAIVNNVAVNMGVHISLWDLALVLLDMYLEVELLDHLVILLLIF